MQNNPETPAIAAPTPDEIAERAFQLWNQDGRPAVNEELYWMAAEDDLREERRLPG
jgi:hypothetical protein